MVVVIIKVIVKIDLMAKLTVRLIMMMMKRRISLLIMRRMLIMMFVLAMVRIMMADAMVVVIRACAPFPTFCPPVCDFSPPTGAPQSGGLPVPLCPRLPFDLTIGSLSPDASSHRRRGEPDAKGCLYRPRISLGYCGCRQQRG